MSRISRAERTRWDKLTVFYFSTKSNQPFSSSSDSSFAGLFLSSVTSFLSPPAVGSVDERKFSTSKSTQASTLEEARAHTDHVSYPRTRSRNEAVTHKKVQSRNNARKVIYGHATQGARTHENSRSRNAALTHEK